MKLTCQFLSRYNHTFDVLLSKKLNIRVLGDKMQNDT